MTLRPLRSTWILFVGLSVSVGCGRAPEPVETARPPEPTPVASPAELAEDIIVGVKIYRTERELPALFEEWQGLGINAVFSGEELTSTGGFRALARSNELELFVIFPVFFAPEVLAQESDLWAMTADGELAKEDWVEFVCPSRPEFRNRRVKEAIGIVKRLRPDGLSIDFIRHFVYWEMVGPDRDPASLPETCYCVHCLQGFATFLGVPALSIPPLPQKAAAWIETNAADAWVRFKTQTITSMAADIAEAVRAVDPEILVNLHIVPWRRDDYGGALTRIVGQDPEALSGIADYLSPMTYSFMLRRPPEWVTSVVQDLDWMADCPVLPSIQVAPAYRTDEAFTTAEFEAALRAALAPPSAGVVFWSWDHIEADSERAAVIRRVVGGGASDPAPAGRASPTSASQSAGTAATSAPPTPTR